MGYIKHNAIIVVGWRDKIVRAAHDEAVRVFGELAGNIIKSKMNGYQSFFIAPDGSKEGWVDSSEHDEKREGYLNWLSKQDDLKCDYVEVRFGGDDEYEAIVRSSSTDSIEQP